MELPHAQHTRISWLVPEKLPGRFAVTTPALSQFVLIKHRGTHDFRHFHAVLLENAIMRDISAVGFQMHW